MGFVLFVLVAFVLLAVDASVYLAVAEPALLALGAPAVAGPRQDVRVGKSAVSRDHGPGQSNGGPRTLTDSLPLGPYLSSDRCVLLLDSDESPPFASVTTVVGRLTVRFGLGKQSGVVATTVSGSVATEARPY